MIDFKEKFSDPAFVAEYEAWLRHPVTQLMQQATLEQCIPMDIDMRSSEASSLAMRAMYQYAMVVGYHSMRALVFHADRFAKNTRQAAGLEPDYGAEEWVEQLRKNGLLRLTKETRNE